MTLHERFQDHVAHGTFAGTPYAEELTHLASATWHRAPISGLDTAASFGGQEWLQQALADYLTPEKLVPVEHPVCVEDDISAVYLKNLPTGAGIVADYRLVMPGVDAVITAQVTKAGDLFAVENLYLGLIDGGRCHAPRDPRLIVDAAVNLVKSTNTALEQLAYLHSRN